MYRLEASGRTRDLEERETSALTAGQVRSTAIAVIPTSLRRRVPDRRSRRADTAASPILALLSPVDAEEDVIFSI
jgi:hypothetical protein